ncbi:MAG: DUF3999 family protein [Acidobacteria bacterium]|nr:DUF3999 family protein [Candidatus Sulfomarinibacter kjeldsenii]
MKTSLVIRGGVVGLMCIVLVPFVGICGETEPSIERGVEPGGPGGNRLEVDVDLLAGAANDLRDLRFVSATGEEVPYLLLAQPRAERKWKDGKVLPLRRTKSSSGFEVDLGEAIQIDRVRIEGLPAPFLKRVRIEAGGDRTRWTLLHEQATLFDLPDEGLRLLDLDFEPGEYRYLRVVWSDRSSGRLPLPGRVSARLLEGSPPPPPLRAQLTVDQRASEPGISRYRVLLPAPGLPIVGLELEVESSYVLRPARVTEARLSGSEIRPSVLGQATLRRVVHEDLVASQMEIPISTPTESEVMIEVDNGDNPPLELRTVTARFAPQPWIYFESPDGQELIARYGALGLRAPSYDLAALREALGPAGISRGVNDARFGETRHLVVKTTPEELAIEDAVGGGAKIKLAGFRIRRAVGEGQPGLNALRLDPAVLAGSGSLSELRIVDGRSVQVPYIQESLGEPTVLDLAEPAPVPEQAGERQSAYALTLPYDTLPAARLTIMTTARVFERRVRLVRVEDRNPRDPPVQVVLDEQVWRNRDTGREAPHLRLTVPARAGAELLLIVDEGDNSPLQIGEPKLYLPTYRLRFLRRNEDPLWLMYGHDGLAAPRYDLALLAPMVLGARVPEIGLSDAEEGLPAISASRIGMMVFWGMLVLVLIVLFGMVARLLRRGPDDE